MYRPEHFAPPDRAALLALMAAHPLATLIHMADSRLCADTIPLMFEDATASSAASGSSAEAPAQGLLRGHVARANPLWRSADGREVLVQFNGPQAYVSPSYYPSKAEHGKVVPTWNYVLVQAHGRLRAVDDAQATHRLVSELTRHHETPRAAPWAVDDAPPDYVAQMVRAIVGVEISVTSLVGKWKLSQNRGAADRDGVAQGLAAEPLESARAVAPWVRDPAAP
jgi:transcriptional regulator